MYVKFDHVTHLHGVTKLFIIYLPIQQPHIKSIISWCGQRKTTTTTEDKKKPSI